MRERDDRLELALALVLTALALFLHVRTLTHAGPLWRDEANTIAVATKPGLGALAAALEHESFPILPFVLVRIWSGVFGSGDLPLRAFGFVVGIGILGAIWTACALLGTRPPVLALALAGLNPVLVRWGDSLRAYGLGALLIVLTFGALYRLARAPSAPRAAWAALGALLSVQCMYQNALLLAALAAAASALALVERRPRAIPVVAAVGALAALSLLPYLPAIARARDHFAVITTTASWTRIGRALLEALGSPAEGLVHVAGAWVVVAAATIVAGALALRKRWAQERDPLVYGLAVLTIAPLAFLAFLWALKFRTESWYYVVLLALVAAAVDAVWSGLARVRALRLARLGLAVVVAGMTLVPAVRLVGLRQTNVDRAARALEEVAREGDLVVVNPWFFGISFGRYYRGSAAWTTAPPLADVTIHRFDLLKQTMTQADPLEPLLRRMGETLAAGHRVFVAGMLSAPPRGQPARRLPPPPLPRTGWYSLPYLTAWSEELGSFLETRATRGAPLPAGVDASVSVQERIALWQVEGWRAGR